jgi:diguanylate cyclase (GGDEF)-like protein
MLSEPAIVAAVLPASGVASLIAVIPARDWSTPVLVTLWCSLIFGTVVAGLRFVVGRRRALPPWSLHVEIGVGNVFVTAVVVMAAAQHIRLGNLYLLTATVAILLFSVRAALAHIGAAGVYYAAVLAFAPATGEPPVLAWLAVFGTAAVVGTVVMGLVSVLRLAATADPLTGLANRRAWDERLDEEMERTRRTGTALSVVLIDLDGFKDVNDRDGHAAGDHLLQTLARAWQTQVRGGGDFLARIGGDEFAVIAPGSDQMGIHRLIRRLDEAAPVGTHFSAGEATWDGKESAPDLLRRADLAMYETKLKHRREHYTHTA